MRLLLVIFVIALLVGPLRRPLLRRATFTIPAIAGTIVGLGLGMFVAARAGIPGPMAALLGLGAAAAMGVSLGEAFKNWFDRTFGGSPPRGSP